VLLLQLSSYYTAAATAATPTSPATGVAASTVFQLATFYAAYDLCVQLYRARTQQLCSQTALSYIVPTE
jgi:hypothetical protein